MTGAAASATFDALGSTATVFVTDADAVDTARGMLSDILDDVDAACSRFREDSELSRLNRSPGRPAYVSALLLEAIEAALRAAELSTGDVDPTVGQTMRALGYDRDFELLRDDSTATVTLVPAPGWRKVSLDRAASTVTLPPGVELDLGATGKAFAADRAAAAIHEVVGCGVLVNLGGDLAIAGPAPDGGWRVRIADDHRRPEPLAETVTIVSGAIATSSVTARNWHAGGRAVHHIVNPRTGAPADVVWRTVTVAAGSCVDANTASTASILRAELAPAWLESLSLPSRLVAADGHVVRIAGWPQSPR